MDAAKAQKLAQLQAMMDAVPADAGGEDESDDAYCRPQGRLERKQRRETDGNSEVERGMAGMEPAVPPEKVAFNRVVDLCSYHEFCTSQMRKKLRRDGLPEHAIDKAIDKSVRIGLIDDLRWGEMRASALMRRGMGNAGIARDLKENGINAYDIEGWPACHEERFGGELERALAVLEKNPPRSKNPRGSAYGKLMRKGYPSSVALRASAIWFSQHNEDA